MHLGKDSAYGVFALVEMATRGTDSPVAVEDLAESCGIPHESLSVILPKLVEAGIVRRDAGPPERFALPGPADQITLLQIVEAIEGKQEPELLLPRYAGSTDKPASSCAAAEMGQPACIDQPAWQPVGSLAAVLLGANIVQDLLNADSGSKSHRSDGNGNSPDC